jgi:hypothetical protein
MSKRPALPARATGKIQAQQFGTRPYFLQFKMTSGGEAHAAQIGLQD